MPAASLSIKEVWEQSAACDTRAVGVGEGRVLTPLLDQNHGLQETIGYMCLACSSHWPRRCGGCSSPSGPTQRFESFR